MFDSSETCRESTVAMQLCREESSTTSMAVSGREGTTSVILKSFVILLICLL